MLNQPGPYGNYCVPSTLHQMLAFWDGDKTEYVLASHSVHLSCANMMRLPLESINNSFVIKPLKANLKNLPFDCLIKRGMDPEA